MWSSQFALAVAVEVDSTIRVYLRKRQMTLVLFSVDNELLCSSESVPQGELQALKFLVKSWPVKRGPVCSGKRVRFSRLDLGASPRSSQFGMENAACSIPCSTPSLAQPHMQPDPRRNEEDGILNRISDFSFSMGERHREGHALCIRMGECSLDAGPSPPVRLLFHCILNSCLKLLDQFSLELMSQEVKVLTADGHDLVLDAEFLDVCSKVKERVVGGFFH
jgi:hypothetical protein